MTDWRGDLLKIGIIPDDMPDQTNFVLFNLDELANHMIKELDRAREEGRKERTDELKQAFHEVFYKSGELWFNYIFEDGDTKAEQEAKGVVEDYWDEIISKLRTKEDEEKNREDTG